MQPQHLAPLFSVLLIFGLYVSVQSQSVVTLESDRDNTLYWDTTGSVSNGAGDHLFAGVALRDANDRRRALLRFDVTIIPQVAELDSVALDLYMSRTISAQTEVRLHRLLRDWGEGGSNAPLEEGTGASATPEDATWLHTFFDDEFWDEPGGDFREEASGSTQVDGIGRYSWSGPQMRDDVAGWLSLPQENFGWIVIADESLVPSAKRFSSRENDEIGNRPQLRVSFKLPVVELPTPVLVSPLPGASVQSTMPTLVWSEGPNGLLSEVQLAEDSTFDVLSETGFGLDDTTFSPAMPLQSDRAFWRVRYLSGNGAGPWSSVRSFSIGSGTGAEIGAPSDFELEVFPNPAANRLVVKTVAGTRSSNEIRMFDVLGREVFNINSGRPRAGVTVSSLDISSLPSGWYWIKVGDAVRSVVVTR